MTVSNLPTATIKKTGKKVYISTSWSELGTILYKLVDAEGNFVYKTNYYHWTEHDIVLNK